MDVRYSHREFCSDSVCSNIVFSQRTGTVCAFQGSFRKCLPDQNKTCGAQVLSLPLPLPNPIHCCKAVSTSERPYKVSYSSTHATGLMLHAVREQCLRSAEMSFVELSRPLHGALVMAVSRLFDHLSRQLITRTASTWSNYTIYH
jgi:hypothetical protein